MRFALKDELYQNWIHFIIEKPEDAKKHLRRKFGLEAELNGGGQMWKLDNYYIVWIDPKEKAHFKSFITHELLHVALYVFENVDIEVTAEDSEPLCYYLQWLVQKFWEKYEAH